MPRYEVEINGQRYEVEAPDEDGVRIAIGQIQGAPAPAASPAAGQLDDYYSSGIYSGSMNPLGPIARSLDAATTGVGDALTFGFGDEISGLWGGTDSQRQRADALQTSNPVASMVGNVAGGAVGAGALSAGGILPSLPQGASLLSRVGVGAGEGFGLGALYGAGSADGGDVAQSALINGSIGGVAGGAVPLVAQGVSSAYRSIADNLAQNNVARNAGVSPEVARQLAQTLDADGTLGAQGRANMAAAGNEAMLADAGPNARTVLDTAIQRGGPGAVLARNRIEERVGRDSAALTGALDNTLGTPEGVYGAQANIRNASRPAVNDAYNGPSGAYAQPIDYASQAGQRVESIINRIPPRIANRAIQQANERMAYDEIPNMQILANIGDDGSVTFQQMPNVMQADYIKRALNEIARDGTDIGGKMSSDAAFANRMANDLRDAVSEAVPEYATALRTAADPLSRQSAVELGASLLSPSMTRDQVAEATSRYTQGQRDALAQGVRSRIDDVMANVTRTMQDGNTDAREAYKAIRELSSRANREKLTTALGEQRANPLFEELDRVAQSFQLRGSVAENSKTFARQATNEMLKEGASPGAVGTLGRGEPLQASKRVIQALTGQTDEAIRGREDDIASEIADYLTRPAAQAIPAFQAMQNFQGQTLANQVRASEIARLLGEGRNLVYPASGQASDRLRR